MKKILCLVVFSVMLLVNFSQIAQAERVGIEVELNTIKVELNGEEIDLKTILYDDMTYVPLIDVCHYFDCSLDLNVKNKVLNIITQTQPVTKIDFKDQPLNIGKQNIFVTIQLYKITFNSINSYLESLMYENNVYVPIRYFAEIFNKSILWDGENKKVIISNMQDEVIGSVNGESITLREFDYLYSAKYNLNPDVLKSQDSEDEEVMKIKQEIFEQITLNKLIMQKAAENNISISDKDISKLNSNMDYVINQSGGIKSFRALLQKFDIYFNQYVEDYKTYSINSKYINNTIIDVEASEDEILKYYEENNSSFISPEAVTAKHILILTEENDENTAKEKAQGILDKINAGEDFDALMNTYSEDPGLKTYPEGYTFTRGQMVKEFEEAAFSLEVGMVSDLVKTQYGYHIIKLVDKIPEKQLTYEEVRDQIKDELDASVKQEYYDNMIDTWKSESTIENKLF